VVSQKYLSVFDIDELSFLLCGTQQIDIQDWQENTEYKGWSQNSKQVKWFWEVLSSLSQEKLRKFLEFSTGMPRVPIEGFQ